MSSLPPLVWHSVTDIHDWEQERWHTQNMDHWLWVTTCFEHYQEHIMCTGGHHQSLPLSLLYLGDLKPLQAKPAVSTDDDRSTFWEWLSAVYQWCLGEIFHVDENDSHAEESTWSSSSQFFHLVVRFFLVYKQPNFQQEVWLLQLLLTALSEYNYNKSHFCLPQQFKLHGESVLFGDLSYLGVVGSRVPESLSSWGLCWVLHCLATEFCLHIRPPSIPSIISI